MPFADPVKKKEYSRQYRESHKTMFANYQRNYYRSNKAQLDAQNKEWYEKNKSLVLERGKQRYLTYKPKILAYLKDYMKRPGVREKHNLRVKGYRKRDRLLCLGHYSDGKIQCACCGEKEYDFLTIDHVAGGGHKQRKEIHYGHLFRWLMRNNFPDGYRVLCWNCNCSIGLYGRCPHSKAIELVA